MPALEDGCAPQMEMAAENVAATEEAEALTARQVLGKIRQPAVCCRTSVALSNLPLN
jgi:hypothetical protein